MSKQNEASDQRSIESIVVPCSDVELKSLGDVAATSTLRMAAEIMSRKAADAEEWLSTAKYMWSHEREKARREYKAFRIACELIYAAIKKQEGKKEIER